MFFWFHSCLYVSTLFILNVYKQVDDKAIMELISKITKEIYFVIGHCYWNYPIFDIYYQNLSPFQKILRKMYIFSTITMGFRYAVDSTWLYILLRHLVWVTTSWNFFPKDKQKVVPIKDTELHETFLGVSKRSDLWINFTIYPE